MNRKPKPIDIIMESSLKNIIAINLIPQGDFFLEKIISLFYDKARMV